MSMPHLCRKSASNHRGSTRGATVPKPDFPGPTNLTTCRLASGYCSASTTRAAVDPRRQFGAPRSSDRSDDPTPTSYRSHHHRRPRGTKSKSAPTARPRQMRPPSASGPSPCVTASSTTPSTTATRPATRRSRRRGFFVGSYPGRPESPPFALRVSLGTDPGRARGRPVDQAPPVVTPVARPDLGASVVHGLLGVGDVGRVTQLHHRRKRDARLDTPIGPPGVERDATVWSTAPPRRGEDRYGSNGHRLLPRSAHASMLA